MSRDIADLVGEALVCDVDAEAVVLFADAMKGEPADLIALLRRLLTERRTLAAHLTAASLGVWDA